MLGNTAVLFKDDLGFEPDRNVHANLKGNFQLKKGVRYNSANTVHQPLDTLLALSYCATWEASVGADKLFARGRRAPHFVIKQICPPDPFESAMVAARSILRDFCSVYAPYTFPARPVNRERNM